MQTELIQKEKRTAQFSACRTWRYGLVIIWDEARPLVQFIGLNPSTADESKDDPTIRRCKGFARSWGHGGIIMTNLWPLMETLPAKMKLHPRPQGEPVQWGTLNDGAILAASKVCALTVAAWGTHGEWQGRGDFVKVFIERLHCLRRTGTRNIRFICRGDLVPVPFNF